MAPAAARPGPKKFSELDCISQPTLDVITSLGFQTTTPVQEATIPLFCGNKDVAVDACTGSGKTLAFAVPVVERLRKLEEPLKTHQVGAIIISPTRELAKQIYGVAEPFIASVPGLTAMLLVGGTDPAADVSAFKARGGHVLIGTPGRIDDIIKRCTAMDLRRMEVLVLDEADRLLDMGFKAQLDSVMGRLPKQRRTGLFSATQTEAVQELARAGLRNPVRVNVAVAVAHPPKQQPEEGAKGSSKGSKDGGKGKGQQAEDDLDADVAGEAAAAAAAGAGADVEGVQKTPNSLSISYVVCEADEKIPQLVRFLRIHGPQRKVIVYGMTCAAVDHLAAVLPRLPQLRGRVVLRALHGKMKQAARERELEAFRAMPAGVLLCTDLAARGLDIPDVHWIVQLDPPQDPAAFVHRVGRTARMGRAGSALVLLMPHEGTYVEFLRLRKVPMTEGTPLTPEDVPEDEPAASPAAAGGGAARGGAASTSGRGGGGTAAAASKGSAARAAGAGVSSAGTGSGDVLAALRRAAETDRDVMDKATRSFVTYIRGYKEHHCKFIFRVQDLNVGRLASGLGLLRLPRMPDLRKPLGAEEFVPSPVDPATVPYKDKAREKQRQKALQAKAAEAARNGDAAAAGQKRKAAAAAAPAAAEGEARLTAAKRRQLQAIDEAANLNQEYTLLKKLKRGKITQHQFNVAMGLSSDSEAEAGDDEDKGGKQQQQQGQGQQRAGGAVGGGSDGDDDGGASDGEGEGGGSSGDEDGGEGGGAEGRTGGGAGGSGARGKLAAVGRQHGKGRGKRQQGGGAGAAAGRTQKALGLRQPQGALQSYMQKKARKQKKKKAKRAASGTGGA